MNPIKIGIADENEIYRKGLIATICDAEHIRLVLEAGSGNELPAYLDGGAPDVLLLDVNPPHAVPAEGCRRIRAVAPEIKILALSMHKDEDFVLGMLKAGINGFLLKSAHPEEIKRAVEKVSIDGWYFNDHVSAVMLRTLTEHSSRRVIMKHANGLSSSEVNVLKLICQQYTNPQIADKLNMGVRTVDGHRNRMLSKTGAKNTAGLVMFAVKNGLAEI